MIKHIYTQHVCCFVVPSQDCHSPLDSTRATGSQDVECHEADQQKEAASGNAGLHTETACGPVDPKENVWKTANPRGSCGSLGSDLDSVDGATTLFSGQ